MPDSIHCFAVASGVNLDTSEQEVMAVAKAVLMLAQQSQRTYVFVSTCLHYW